MGSKPPHTRKGQQGFPFQTLPHRPETAWRKAAQVRLPAKKQVACIGNCSEPHHIYSQNRMIPCFLAAAQLILLIYGAVTLFEFP